VIHYVTTAKHAYPMERFIAQWGSPLANRVTRWAWDGFRSRVKLPGGAWILADLERLGPGAREVAAQVADQLEASPACRVLNHPGRWKDRYELLDHRFRSGDHRWRAVRAADGRPDRFPQFVRAADDHDGPRTGLLTSAAQVDEAVLQLVLAGFDPGKLLVVEACDVRDPQGRYVKHSVIRVGDRYVPKHKIFSHQWVQKLPDILGPDELALDRAFLETDPHHDAVHAAFEQAGVRYGRIDYGIRDGKLQVWEINTNPILMLARDAYRPEQLPAQEWAAPRIIAAFEALDQGLEPGSVRVALRAPGAGQASA
jgi:hypothetical protein